MPAIKWKQHKSAKLQDPKPTTTVKTHIEAATTKKKGRQAQKWLDKCYRKMDSTKKAKTERGEERPEGRTHHCGYCRKAFTNVCKAKGHMIPCDDHPTVYHMPGNPCHTCVEEDEAEQRGAAKAAEDEKARKERAKEDVFFLQGQGRKKGHPAT